MGILKNEICKLLTKRTVLILLLLIVINPLIQLYVINTPGEEGYSLKDYSNVYCEISSYNQNEIITEIEKEVINAENFTEESLYSRIYNEVEGCLTYDEYLESIDKKAAAISIMNIYAGDNGYAVRNAEKTREVYQKLKGTEPKVQDPMGVLNITNSEFTDYIAVIMIFTVALNLVFFEKNGEQLKLLRTTVNGRRRLMESKVAAMVLSVFFIIVSLYTSNAIISKFVYGSIDFQSSIQSIYLYRNSSFGISIGEFLVLYFIVKFLSCVLLGIGFMLICSVFQHIVFVFAVAAAAVIIESLFYIKISGLHFLAFLKYINIMYGLKTSDIFSDYVNLSVFDYPFNTFAMYLAVWLIAMVIFTAGVINYLEISHEKNSQKFKMPDIFKRFECHTSVFMHEFHKMLFPGKTLGVLVISCLFVIWWNPEESILFEDYDEVYYKEYSEKFYGPLDADKYELIDEEVKKYELISAEIMKEAEKGNAWYVTAKYQKEMERQGGFEKLLEHVSYLESVEGGWVFYGKGYAVLTDGSNYRNRDISQAFVYIIILVAMVSGIYGLDYSNSEMRILNTTFNGRGKLRRKKGILGLLCTVITFAMVYVVRLVNVLNVYGTDGINAPAASMEHLSKIPMNISVLQYLLIIMAMRFIGGIIIVWIVFMLFKHFQNSIQVILVCVLLFILPLIFAAIDIPNAEYILFNPLLLGNVF